jgi:hypothetical protein
MLTLHISALDRLRSLLSFNDRAETSIRTKAPSNQTLPALTQEGKPKRLNPLPPLASDDDRKQAARLVQQLAEQFPYALAVAVLHANGDMPLAHAGIPRESSPASLAVQFGRIARQSVEMVAAVSPEEGEMQEIICASEQQTHILVPVNNHPWWLYLAIEAKDSNMAIARSLMHASISWFAATPPAKPAS